MPGPSPETTSNRPISYRIKTHNSNTTFVTESSHHAELPHDDDDDNDSEPPMPIRKTKSESNMGFNNSLNKRNTVAGNLNIDSMDPTGTRSSTVKNLKNLEILKLTSEHQSVSTATTPKGPTSNPLLTRKSMVATLSSTQQTKQTNDLKQNFDHLPPNKRPIRYEYPEGKNSNQNEENIPGISGGYNSQSAPNIFQNHSLNSRCNPINQNDSPSQNHDPQSPARPDIQLSKDIKIPSALIESLKSFSTQVGAGNAATMLESSFKTTNSEDKTQSQSQKRKSTIGLSPQGRKSQALKRHSTVGPGGIGRASVSISNIKTNLNQSVKFNHRNSENQYYDDDDGEEDDNNPDDYLDEEDEIDRQVRQLNDMNLKPSLFGFSRSGTTQSLQSEGGKKPPRKSVISELKRGLSFGLFGNSSKKDDSDTDSEASWNEYLRKNKVSNRKSRVSVKKNDSSRKSQVQVSDSDQNTKSGKSRATVVFDTLGFKAEDDDDDDEIEDGDEENIEDYDYNQNYQSNYQSKKSSSFQYDIQNESGIGEIIDNDDQNEKKLTDQSEFKYAVGYGLSDDTPYLEDDVDNIDMRNIFDTSERKGGAYSKEIDPAMTPQQQSPTNAKDAKLNFAQNYLQSPGLYSQNNTERKPSKLQPFPTLLYNQNTKKPVSAIEIAHHVRKNNESKNRKRAQILMENAGLNEEEALQAASQMKQDELINFYSKARRKRRENLRLDAEQANGLTEIGRQARIKCQREALPIHQYGKPSFWKTVHESFNWAEYKWQQREKPEDRKLRREKIRKKRQSDRKKEEQKMKKESRETIRQARLTEMKENYSGSGGGGRNTVTAGTSRNSNNYNNMNSDGNLNDDDSSGGAVTVRKTRSMYESSTSRKSQMTSSGRKSTNLRDGQHYMVPDNDSASAEGYSGSLCQQDQSVGKSVEIVNNLTDVSVCVQQAQSDHDNDNSVSQDSVVVNLNQKDIQSLSGPEFNDKLLFEPLTLNLEPIEGSHSANSPGIDSRLSSFDMTEYKKSILTSPKSQSQSESLTRSKANTNRSPKTVTVTSKTKSELGNMSQTNQETNTVDIDCHTHFSEGSHSSPSHSQGIGSGRHTVTSTPINKSPTTSGSGKNNVRKFQSAVNSVQKMNSLNSGNTGNSMSVTKTNSMSPKSQQTASQYSNNPNYQYSMNQNSMNTIGTGTLLDADDLLNDHMKSVNSTVQDEAQLAEEAAIDAELEKETRFQRYCHMIYTGIHVLSAVISYHTIPFINEMLIVRIILRVFPLLEFLVHYLAIFCEPQLGHYMGQICLWNQLQLGQQPEPQTVAPILLTSQNSQQSQIDPNAGNFPSNLPIQYNNNYEYATNDLGDPVGEVLSIYTYTFGLGIPYSCVVLVWYRALPYIVGMISKNPTVIRLSMWIRSLWFVQPQGPQSLGSTGVDVGSLGLEEMIKFLFFLIFILFLIFHPIRLLLGCSVDLYCIMVYFPLLPITGHFPLQYRYFKGMLMSLLGSLSFILFDLIIIEDANKGIDLYTKYQRESHYAIMGMVISIINIITFIILVWKDVASNNQLTLFESLKLTSLMGRGSIQVQTRHGQEMAIRRRRRGEGWEGFTDDVPEIERIWPPFFLALVSSPMMDLRHERFQLNHFQILRIAEALWNNPNLKHIQIRPTMLQEVVKSSSLLGNWINDCVVNKGNSVLQTINGFKIKDWMNMDRLIYSQDVYKYGGKRVRLDAETGVGLRCIKYLTIGEEVPPPVTDFECILMCKILQYNHKLQQLDLSSCLLKDYSFLALSSYLEGNASLRFLDVSNNCLLSLRDETLDTFLGAVTSHGFLEEAQFSHTTIPVPLGALRQHKQVTTIPVPLGALKQHKASTLLLNSHRVYARCIERLVSNIVSRLKSLGFEYQNFPGPEHFPGSTSKGSGGDGDQNEESVAHKRPDLECYMKLIKRAILCDFEMHREFYQLIPDPREYSSDNSKDYADQSFIPGTMPGNSGLSFMSKKGKNKSSSSQGSGNNNSKLQLEREDAKDLHSNLFLLREFVIERVALELGHDDIDDPNDLLDLYVDEYADSKITEFIMKEQEKYQSEEARILQGIGRTETGGQEPGGPSMIRYSVNSMYDQEVMNNSQQDGGNDNIGNLNGQCGFEDIDNFQQIQGAMVMSPMKSNKKTTRDTVISPEYGLTQSDQLNAVMNLGSAQSNNRINLNEDSEPNQDLNQEQTEQNFQKNKHNVDILTNRDSLVYNNGYRDPGPIYARPLFGSKSRSVVGTFGVPETGSGGASINVVEGRHSAGPPPHPNLVKKNDSISSLVVDHQGSAASAASGGGGGGGYGSVTNSVEIVRNMSSTKSDMAPSVGNNSNTNPQQNLKNTTGHGGQINSHRTSVKSLPHQIQTRIDSHLIDQVQNTGQLSGLIEAFGMSERLQKQNYNMTMMQLRRWDSGGGGSMEHLDSIDQDDGNNILTPQQQQQHTSTLKSIPLATHSPSQNLNQGTTNSINLLNLNSVTSKIPVPGSFNTTSGASASNLSASLSRNNQTNALGEKIRWLEAKVKKKKNYTIAEEKQRKLMFIPNHERVKPTKLGSVEGMCIAMGLKQHVVTLGLKEISLAGNRIRDRGAEMFFRLLLEEGNSMEVLSLEDNEIGYGRNNYQKGRAVKWLERVIKSRNRNENLKRLELGRNDAFYSFASEIGLLVTERIRENPEDEKLVVRVNH